MTSHSEGVEVLLMMLEEMGYSYLQIGVPLCMGAFFIDDISI